MKFRIMENSSGRYVQKKVFGIWWNWFAYINSFGLFKRYYDSSVSDLEYEIIESNKKPIIKPSKLLKEFEV